MSRPHVIRLFLSASLLLVFLAGCTRTRPFTPAEADLPSAFPYHTHPQITAFVASAADAPKALQARASLSVTSPERGGRFSAELRMSGDSLYISISPGLGIEAVRVLATGDSIFVYDRLDNRVRYGSIQDAEAVIPIPLGGEQLTRNVVGLLLPRADDDWELSADSSLYHLTNPSRTERFVVDPAIWRVAAYERFTEDGDLVEERRFEQFSDVEGYILPRRLIFRRPGEQTALVLTYREIDPSPGPLSFNLRVSDGARWTPVNP